MLQRRARKWIKQSFLSHTTYEIKKKEGLQGDKQNSKEGRKAKDLE